MSSCILVNYAIYTQLFILKNVLYILISFYALFQQIFKIWSFVTAISQQQKLINLISDNSK